MSRYTKEEKAESLKTLRDLLKPGGTVYTILRRRSASGTSRQISLVIIDPRDGELLDISWDVSRAVDYGRNPDNHALRVSGCGMDMGFSVVYNLGRALWPDGFPCSGKSTGDRRCRSNAHSNGEPYIKGPKHGDAGYALNQKWL